MRLLSPTEKGYDELDTSYADLLVDLAVEKGFEGWLINIEVALPGGEAQASLLSSWLDYLTRETKRRIPGGEIIWYDAVTTRGELRWQDRVTPLNEPLCPAMYSLLLACPFDAQLPEDYASERAREAGGRTRLAARRSRRVSQRRAVAEQDPVP